MIETFRERLQNAWSFSDRVFDLIHRDRWLDQPIKLRHPVLFYVGHLPAFAWNQVGAGLLGHAPQHAEFDQLFERGIDPVAADAHSAVVEWPSVEEVLEYRDRVRSRLLEAVDEVAALADRNPLAARGRILHVVLEHEAMHQETLQYMFLELPEGTVQRPVDTPPYQLDGSVDREEVEVGPGSAVLGAEFDAVDFGWDNEFPTQRVEVEGFWIDRMPVTVGEWLDFLEAGGYRNPDLWQEADWSWRKRIGLEHPPRWRSSANGWRYRTMFDELDLEAVRAWPVMVSLAEARAYCAWRGDRRLPTEPELHRALHGGGDRRHPWGAEPPAPGRHGNFGFANWSPTPVSAHPEGESPWGLLDGIGNAWEWTSTLFRGLPGFEPTIPTYPGYSADFFDDRHFVMLGASWATPTPLIRRSFRNWFQDRYPYAFAGFRTVRAD